MGRSLCIYRGNISHIYVCVCIDVQMNRCMYAVRLRLRERERGDFVFCFLFFVLLGCLERKKERERKRKKGIKEENEQRVGRGNLERPKDSVSCDFWSIYSLSRRRVLHPLL